MKRVSFIVTVDLDPVPGPFSTKENAMAQVNGILHDMIPHYNPEVILAHAMSQPGYTQSEYTDVELDQMDYDDKHSL